MNVDLSPLYGPLNETLVLIGSGLITWIGIEARAFLQHRAAFLGQQLDTEMANGLNRALQNGMTIGLNDLQAWEKAHSDVKVKGLVQGIAVDYALKHAPEAIDHFGLSPEDLAQKALAFLPPPPSLMGSSAPVVPVEVKPLAPVK